MSTLFERRTMMLERAKSYIFDAVGKSEERCDQVVKVIQEAINDTPRTEVENHLLAIAAGKTVKDWFKALPIQNFQYEELVTALANDLIAAE